MPSPQLEHGYTSIANELLEQLIRELTSSGTQLAIMLLVMRYSYGFKRKHADFTVSEMAPLLDIDRRQVGRAVKVLYNRNMLLIESREGHLRLRFQIQKDYSLWGGTNSPMGSLVPWDKKSRKVGLIVPEGGIKSPTSKKVSKKDSKKSPAPARAKAGKFVPVWPDWVDPKEAADFEAVRREKRATLTPRAFQLLINKLDKWRAKGVDPNMVLAHSSSNSYTGVFPEKFAKGGPQQTHMEESWDKLQQAVEGE